MLDKLSIFPNTSRPPSIGIFDSGVGGLTVLRALLSSEIAAHYLYLGDTARMPYGPKPVSAIQRYGFECSEWLIQRGAQALVIACHTSASTGVGPLLASAFQVPVLDISQATLRLLQDSRAQGPVVVLGTTTTIQSGIYERWVTTHLPHRPYTGIACPLLGPIVEEGLAEHAVAQLMIEHYLKVLPDTSEGSLVLGCTHYPALLPLFRQALGSGWEIIDPSSQCIRLVQMLVSQRGRPSAQWAVTESPKKLEAVGPILLGHDLGPCELAQLCARPVLSSS